MLRGAFICSALSNMFAAVATPSPSASSSPPPGVDPLERCDATNLPLKRPLEIEDTTLDGPAFRLTKYRGYAVWMYIFATWCPPCKVEQPMVTRLAHEYRAAGLRTIGVFNLDDGDTDDAVRRYRSTFGITYPLMRDKTGLLTRFVDSTPRGDKIYTLYPSHYFITAWGDLWCHRDGSLSEREARYKIERLLTSVSTPLPAEPDPRLSPLPWASTGAATPLG